MLKSQRFKQALELMLIFFLWLQEEAEKQHMPYQALMNKYLREAMNKPSLENRLAALEKAIFKKAP
jgi:hypothetical protein